MTNTTPRYYAINGTSLQTYRWNLVKIDGMNSRPPMRGVNPKTPYRHGSYSFGRKFFEEKFMTMRMAILNTDADGAVTLTNNWDHLYKNLDDFFSLLYDDDSLLLSKYLADEATQREIDVEVIDEIQVKTEASDQRYLITVPLLAARPFWRELPMITDTELAITGTRAFNIDIGGNAPTDDMIITIDCTASGSSPKLSVPVNGDYVEVSDAGITAGDQLIINLRDREFTKNGVRNDQAIARATAWFIELPQGPATLGMEFTSVSGTYNLKIERYSKWF